MKNNNQKSGWCSAAKPVPSVRAFSRMPAQYLTDSRLKERELRVLLALSAHANDETGECSPSQLRLAALCGFWRTARASEHCPSPSGKIPDTWLLSRIIKTLASYGYLKTARAPGYNQRNTYRLAFPDIDAENRTYKDFFTARDEQTSAEQEVIESDEHFYSDKLTGALLSRQDIIDAIKSFQETNEKLVPDAALTHFSLTWDSVAVLASDAEEPEFYEEDFCTGDD